MPLQRLSISLGLRSSLFFASRLRTLRTSSPAMQQIGSSHEKRFALLVIGDEILKGQVSDTNTHFLCRQLTSLGHRICEVSIIPDDKLIIADRVRALSAGYDFVITSGGIGPTHDDVTFEAIAAAFDEPIRHHPEMVAIVRRYFDKSADPNEPLEAYAHKPYMRLSRLPSSAMLNYGVDRLNGRRTDYPVVSVRNVFAFPGIPSLCQKAYRLVERQFIRGAVNDSQQHLTSSNIYVNLDEIRLTPAIDKLVAAFPRVVVGSYPEWHNHYYQTRIYLEAPTVDELNAARRVLVDQIDPSKLVWYDAEPLSGAELKMQHFLVEADSKGWGQFRAAYNVVRGALDTHGLAGVAVGFNGGKDCTALLHLVHAAALSVAGKDQLVKQPLRVLYLRSRQQFPEAELFIDETVQRYGVQLIAYEGAMMTCLTDAKRDWPQIRAIYMGTRRTDPRAGELKHEQVTDVDKGWPEFMRVSPLLDWSYADVWHFLRGLSLPYCPLYDRGYTSLGDMPNTHPNPRLQYKDSLGLLKYRPAYRLESGDDERRGRNQPPQQRAGSPSASNGGKDARPSL